jgi:hypothetical protein
MLAHLQPDCLGGLAVAAILVETMFQFFHTRFQRRVLPSHRFKLPA